MSERLKLQQLKDRFPNCKFERCAKKKEAKIFNDKWELLKILSDKNLMVKKNIKKG